MRHFVLDTNVVVSALLWGGVPRKLIDAADSGQIRLTTSVAMLREMTGILARAKFTAKIEASGLTINQIVDGYAAFTEIVRPATTPRVAPDKDDDVVVGTALAAGAEAVVTGDLPFRSIRRWQDVEIISVRDALARIAAG